MSTRPSRYRSQLPGERLPPWLRRPVGTASALETVQAVVKQQRLHTICEEGRCPNRGECYAAGTATFLLGGPVCTRSCAFCQVDKGRSPAPFDPQEAERVAGAVATLGLRYVVLTAVARDDLDDHGASLFTRTMAAIRRRDPRWGSRCSPPISGAASGIRSPGRRPSADGCRRCSRLGPPATTTTSKRWSACRGRCAGAPPTPAPSRCWRRPGSWRRTFPPSRG